MGGLLGRVHTHTSLWDYHNSFVHFRQFGKRRAQRLARLSEQILLRSSTCDVISEPMRSDIAARTGRSDVIIVHSGFEPWQIKRLAEAEPAPTASIRIAYTGSIIAPATFELFVRALETDERPTGETPLKTAPYWNCDAAGRVCLGSMRVPDETTVESIAGWQMGFFRSQFTHANGAVRLTSHTGGFLGLWKILKGSQDPFPTEFLTDAKETLRQFVERD